MAMFPDSGVPPGEAKNSLPDVNTAGCDELWYSTARCQPRFDPAAANAMLAEDMNLIMRGMVTYECTRLDHIERAVRYIDQRGLTTGTALTGGPFDYSCAMDPTLTHYNNFLTLVIIPNQNNQGVTRINIDGHGLVPVLRNDFQQLVSGDLKAGIPAIISYWAGNFFHVGLVASQVPLVVKGGIDCWIRTDGNDFTGDGTANSPDKAFRTIAGCWQTVGSRYAATPLFTMNFRLGIPGDYEGAPVGPFGGNWTLTGDRNNPSGYRVHTRNMFGDTWGCIWVEGIARAEIFGIELVMNRPTASSMSALWCIGTAGVRLGDSRIVALASHPNGVAINCQGASFAITIGNLVFAGNGHTQWGFMACNNGSAGGASVVNAGELGHYYLDSANFSSAALTCSGLGVMSWGNSQIHSSNVNGVKYLVTENSIINMSGQPPPGTLPGVEGSGGRFIP